MSVSTTETYESYHYSSSVSNYGSNGSSSTSTTTTGGSRSNNYDGSKFIAPAYNAPAYNDWSTSSYQSRSRSSSPACMRALEEQQEKRAGGGNYYPNKDQLDLAGYPGQNKPGSRDYLGRAARLLDKCYSSNNATTKWSSSSPPTQYSSPDREYYIPVKSEISSSDVTQDWSDHALWWPERNRWLSHTRSTLDQYGVSAEAQLIFTPMHKNVTIQLPDLQNITKSVDFSVPVFNSVVQLCKELGIRYPEEVSLKRHIPPELLAKGVLTNSMRTSSSNYVLVNKTIASSQSVQHLDSTTVNIATGKLPIYNSSTNLAGRTGSLPPTPHHKGHKSKTTPEQQQNGDGEAPLLQPPRGSLPRSAAMHQISGGGDGGGDKKCKINEKCEINADRRSLIDTPLAPARALQALGAVAAWRRPKNLAQKAAPNAAWLDSSRSLAEQGLGQNDFLLMRFKFASFFDLNPKVYYV